MNLHIPDRSLKPTPRLFDVADVARMTDAGILGEDEKIELIGGELVRMAAKKFQHDFLKTAVANEIGHSLSRDFFVAVECTLRLGPATLVEPDILVCRKRAFQTSPEGFLEVPAPEILLLIEIADTSIAYDLGRKATLYAAQGVPDYWVVESETRITRVHRGPGPAGYASVVEVHSHEVLRPLGLDLDTIALHLASIG